MTARDRVLVLVQGVTGGSAVWCFLSTLQILSGKMADTPGLLLIVSLGLIAAIARQRRLLLGSLAMLAMTVLLVSLSDATLVIASHWTHETRMPEEGIGAVVVLSGGVNPDTTISTDALDRLLTGLELVDRGLAPVLVTTTVHEIFPTGAVNSEIDQTRFVTSRLPRILWLRAAAGQSTRDEATAVAALLLPNGLRRIALVTSPMHTRRACAVFEAVGFSVICTPARMRDPSGIPLAPSPRNRLALFGEWVYELAAMGDYAAHGWVSRGKHS